MTAKRTSRITAGWVSIVSVLGCGAEASTEQSVAATAAPPVLAPISSTPLPVGTAIEGAAPTPSGAIALPAPEEGLIVSDESDPADLAPAPPPMETCAESSVETEPIDSILMLIIDTSASMVRLGSSSGESKLELTRAAVADALESLPDVVHVGLMNYPGEDSEGPGCANGNIVVPVGQLGEVGSAHRVSLDDGIRRLEPAGRTPTYEAYLRGVETLASFEAVALSNANRFVALITDGTPTAPVDACEIGAGARPEREAIRDAIVEVVTASAADGVSTFVLGSPGSEPSREDLSRIAEAGETAQPGCSHAGPNFCHLDMTEATDFGAALQAALGQVTSQVLSCSYPIPEEAPDGNQVDRERINVEFQGADGMVEEVLLNTDPACEEGWFFGLDGVELCSATCERVKSSREAKLNLVFGCQSRAVKPVK